MPRTLTIATLTVLCAACALAQVAEPIASGPPPVEELAAEAERLHNEWRFDELKAIALRMVTHYPESAVSWYWRAKAYHTDDEFTEARTAYQRAVEIDPDMLRARLGLVWVAWPLDGEDAQKAVAAELVDYCGDLLERDPDHRLAHLIRAQALERMGDAPGALAEMRQVAELYPEDAEVLYRLGDAIRDAQGSMEEALQVFERALELRPEDMAILSAVAYTAYERQQYDHALRTFERMKRVNLGHYGAYAGCALVYAYGLRDLAAAVPQYRIATALDPTNEDLWRWYALGVSNNGDPVDALDVLDEAIEAGIALERLHIVRGSIYITMGRYDDAITEFTEALELGPKATGSRPSTANWNLARAYYHSERWDEAWRNLLRARELGLDDGRFEAMAEDLREHMPEPEREDEG